MSREKLLENLNSILIEEIKTQINKDDSWLVITLEYSGDGKLWLSPDSKFVEFDEKREVRAPRWRVLADVRQYEDIGYGFTVAGVQGMSVLAQIIKSKNTPKGVILHRTVVEQFFPKIAEPTAVLNSVEGFLDPSLPENKSKAAPRPGRVTRKNMKEGKSCYYCPSTKDLTLHHLIRREMGGATEPENLLVVCRECHDLIHEGHIDDGALVMAVAAKKTDSTFNKVTSGDDGKA